MREMVDFEWEVDDAGYEIVEIREHENKDDLAGRLRDFLSPFDPDVANERKPVGRYLRPRGGTKRTQRLFEDEPALFRTFADTPTTPAGVCGLCQQVWAIGCTRNVGKAKRC